MIGRNNNFTFVTKNLYFILHIGLIGDISIESSSIGHFSLGGSTIGFAFV